MEEDILISGGISGAITDIESEEALEHAEKYYGFIRKSNTDIENIAKNTGYSYVQIMVIKNYLFLDKHKLINGYRCFDPDFAIAQSWHRLAFSPQNITPHDLMLLKHECVEIGFIMEGYSQDVAHDKTNKLGYNYQKMVTDYYNILDKEQNKTNNSLNKYKNTISEEVEEDYGSD